MKLKFWLGHRRKRGEEEEGERDLWMDKIDDIK